LASILFEPVTSMALALADSIAAVGWDLVEQFAETMLTRPGLLAVSSPGLTGASRAYPMNGAVSFEVASRLNRSCNGCLIGSASSNDVHRFELPPIPDGGCDRLACLRILGLSDPSVTSTKEPGWTLRNT
jgi:hypothetical protein